MDLGVAPVDRRMIPLSGASPHAADPVQTTVHELAHLWLLPRPLALITSQGLANVRALAAEDGSPRRIEVRHARDERPADACMWAWLGAADAR